MYVERLSSLFIIPEEKGTGTETPEDILWDRIVGIEYTGYEHVYDIEVEGTHNFIGNGIFAHNTAIQEKGEPPSALKAPDGDPLTDAEIGHIEGIIAKTPPCFTMDITGVYGAWDAYEWASWGEMRPKLQLKWNEVKKMNKVILYDRCNPIDHIVDAWMYLKSNGSTIRAIHLGEFPYGGAAKEVVFDTVDADEILLDIVDGYGLNMGLSEIEVYNED